MPDTPNPSSNATRAPLPPVVFLSRVDPEPVHWLSPGRIARGKLTLLDGDPGTGKSTLLCEFAARLTRGDPLPGGQPAPPRAVILMSAEDDPHDTIRPRLDAAGGDPSRVVAFGVAAEIGPGGTLVQLPDQHDVLRDLITRVEAALVVIDPLAAFLAPRLAAGSDQAVRRALASLTGVAEQTGAAIVAVRHLNKGSGSNPLYRGGGSIGLIGAARCGLLLAPDPDDPARRILAATKANLGPLPPALAFRLLPDPHTGVARIAWDGETDWNATALLQENAASAETRSTLSEARRWLRAALADGPRPGKELLREADHAGIGSNLLYAARKAERVQIHKERVADGRWLWSYAAPTTEESPLPGPPEVR